MDPTGHDERDDHVADRDVPDPPDSLEERDGPEAEPRTGFRGGADVVAGLSTRALVLVGVPALVVMGYLQAVGVSPTKVGAGGALVFGLLYFLPRIVIDLVRQLRDSPRPPRP